MISINRFCFLVMCCKVYQFLKDTLYISFVYFLVYDISAWKLVGSKPPFIYREAQVTVWIYPLYLKSFQFHFPPYFPVLIFLLTINFISPPKLHATNSYKTQEVCYFQRLVCSAWVYYPGIYIFNLGKAWEKLQVFA